MSMLPEDVSSGDKQSVVTAEIIAAIIGHESLPATMQMIADAFHAVYPTRGIAIFVAQGSQFQLEAEAGLPKRSSMNQEGVRTSLFSPVGPGAGLDETVLSEDQAGFVERDDPAFSYPVIHEILATGAVLNVAKPLISSTGETRGAVMTFGSEAEPLDEAMREIVQSLCDLARLAMEHCKLYEEVIHRSQYDRLTGLPNRLLLEDRLRQAMVIAKRQGTRIGVCCIDIDRFDQINGSLGHDMGDACFRLLGERLSASIREVDTLARHGGDAFLLMLRDLSKTSDAASICDRLLNHLNKPLLIDGHSLVMTAGAGISIFPDHGDTPHLLLRNADTAMQAAKNAGRGHFRVYSPAMGRQARRSAEMAAALVTAAASSEFRIVYQPIYTMHREIIGFEALLRWKHHKWGQISPLEFIPVAEKSGVIVSIGDWVIQEVCRQAVTWDAAGVPPVKMFANISGVQLGRPDFALKVAKTLQRSGLSPERLELEITESWIIADLRGAAGKLQKLRDLGIGIAIDDFGTGYSTFNYLRELPLDMLKVDRSFIRRLEGSDCSAASFSTVRAITTMAQQLGLRVVAEGVEREDQVEQLSALGFELMQGFLLSRPLKPQAACSLLRKQQEATPPLLRATA